MQNTYKVTITQDKFNIEYDAAYYEKSSQYDGKYVFETTVSKEILTTNDVRDTYKKLQEVEHAFRDMKTDKLQTRPIYHRLAAQTRGHILLACS
ncbi:MAG: hypothetical protein OMM_13903, partial [Candidatus Magnetoglobus multicellularis str. Araruama]